MPLLAFKLVDHCTHDHIMGMPLFVQDIEHILLDGLQSRDACFPFKIVMEKDNSLLYDSSFTNCFLIFSEGQRQSVSASGSH